MVTFLFYSLLLLSVFMYAHFFMLMFGLRDRKLTEKEEDIAVIVAFVLALLTTAFVYYI